MYSGSPTRVIISAILRGVLIALLLAAFFIAGLLVGHLPSVDAAISHVRAQGATSVPGQYPILAEVQARLNENYLRDQPDQRQLEYAAIRGLVSALNDKYTFFIDPPVAHSESDVLAGKYGGIGVQVKRDEQSKWVLYPFPDAPAAKAGVQNGDILVQVNGKDLDPKIQPDAVDQLLRGEVKNDNGVAIRVKRGTEQKDFSVVFQEIDVPSVVWRVLSEEPTYGYIQILRFTNRTPDEVKNALTDLKGKSVKALVLDVRDNPGGLLQESITISGMFLNGGVIVYERTRASEKTDEAQPNSALTDLPMVVLVNKGTASAAEIVAGALHDRKRATLIGQTTYGKGSVQVIFQLGDKSSLHVTIAEWLSPNRAPIDGKGIAPDIAMIPDPNARDVELGEAILFLRTGKS